ncbi:heme transporter HemC [Rhodothalassium salexigens]|uniref:heme ABC transporter permease n=1 Tax=Rhodothalassium salexigens TaxID=1086 RepID=UPI0019117A61|nr:heme ABC transporter permease [Rhodothalassium salexigens]MBK5910461.1 heme transporter HemC [Rhodothalassium salexigens]MBK5921721.1 heme transporter HemC [Rhodothalassium salexigens]
MHYFANPARFVSLADRLLPWLAAATVLAFLVGLPYALLFSPPDYQQGETVRIMYIHVPSAYLATMGYLGLGIASAVWLIWRHPLADLAAVALAPVGALFTGLTLVTGAVWGKPTWGTWWVWDARLTSMLVLFFLYLGYMALREAIEDPDKAGKAAAILSLVGLINLPIIKFSVDWWNTLHQPASLLRRDGPAMDPSMLTPLLIMLGAFSLYFVTVILWRIKAAVAAKRVDGLRRARAHAAQRARTAA